jgi:hypothetical protein
MSKKHIKGQPKSFISNKDKVSIKTVPLFFSSAGDENDTINLGESVYTQISKEMLIQDKNFKVNYIYDRLTNDSVIKKATEKRSTSIKSKKVVERLYSPTQSIVADEIINTNLTSFKNQSFTSNPNKSALIKNKFTNDRLMTGSMNDKMYIDHVNILKNIWNSAGQNKGKAGLKKLNDSNVTTVKSKYSKLNDTRILKNPSIFTENNITNSNFTQKPLNKVKERCHSSKNRFEQFYQAQIKFVGDKQLNIKREIDKRDRLINDLRKQKN